MWCLTSETDERVIYVVPQSNEIIIGRSSEAGVCSFSITNDASVSRKHVSLTISSDGFSLILQDFGSTYGTFVNNFSNKIQANTQVLLKNNDMVRFGKLNCIWKVSQKNLTTCTSTLKGDSIQNLKIILNKIGGVLKNDWDQTCQYLTMPAITLTIKVVLALVQGSYIVTQEFWNKCLDAVQNHKPLPDPVNFIPEINESTLNKETVSFLPDKRRQSLLNGKKILFFSKRQFDMYKGVLSACSGEPILVEDEVNTSMVSKKDVIVIQYNASSSQDTQTLKYKIDEISQFLKSIDKRVIADAEIGLAILYTSTEKYCNPDFNFSTEVVKTASGQNIKTAKILAPESQAPAMQIRNQNIVINESLSNDNVSVKRKLSCDGSDFEINTNKKQAIGTKNIENDNVNKRKHTGDGDSDVGNPSKKLAVTGKSTQQQNDEDDIFNFIKPNSSNEKDSKDKRLNLSRPQKRKAHCDGNEDDLFNFIKDDKSVESGSTKHKIFNSDSDIIEEQLVSVKTENNKNDITPEDISAMRGIKLQELQQNILNCNQDVKKYIKKEYDDDDLDSKMMELDLGNTVVIVNKDLIVKKEPVYIESSKSALKNFKKFVKVWPTKKQVTVLPKSTVSLILPENYESNSACYDDVEE